MKTIGNVLDFNGESIFVGIDVHQKSWSVSVRFNGMEFKTFSQPPVPEKLMGFLTRNFPNGNYLCCYEAGFSGFWAQRRLNELGASCIVVNPADVPTTDKEKRRKTDRVDSRKLARCLESGALVPIHVPCPELEADRMLVRCRTQLVKDQTRCKNRIQQFLCKFGIVYQGKEQPWSKGHLEWLRDIDLPTGQSRVVLGHYLAELALVKMQIKKVEKDMLNLAKTARYARRYELLKSIPAVGPITAMVFLTEVGDMGRFKSLDDLCSYTGLIPNTHSSGETERIGGMTRRGNTFLKTILIECAWRIIRKDPAMGLSYKNYCQRMKPTKAIVKIARKLLNRMRFVLKNDCEYILGVC